MDRIPRIAIVSDNTLMVVGLRHIIEAMMPTIEVDTHTTVPELHRAETQGAHYYHYFVTARALLTDVPFFMHHHDKCIVLTDSAMTLLPADFHTLDMSQNETQMVRALMLLQHRGHEGRQVPPSAHPHPLPQGAVSKEAQHHAQIRQWMKELSPHAPHTAHAPHAPHTPHSPHEGRPQRHPDIIETSTPLIPPHPATPVTWKRIDGNTQSVQEVSNTMQTAETRYAHPDILPPSGIPATYNSPLPHYTTSTHHPDIIDTPQHASSLASDPSATHPKASDHITPDQLSRREREVLVLMVKGNINKQIATHLNIGLTTVITHRRNLIRKLGMRSIAALTIYAVTHGLLPVEEIEQTD